jgi:parallel beta-helix repeat protein
VWAVASREPAPDQEATFDVLHNEFQHDTQGLVFVNVPARIEDNDFEAATSAAIQVSGGAFVIHRNRIRGGHDFGVNGDALRSASITENEIARNCKGGVILRSARNTQVRGNRLYANGYGVIVLSGFATSPNTIADNLILQQFDDGVAVIGASPIVRANHLLSNNLAGLHLLTLVVPGQPRAVADPLLDGNTILGNGIDTPQRDEYRPKPDARPGAELVNCSRRVAATAPATSVQVVAP